MTTKKNSPQMLLLLLVFVIPMIISWFLFYYHDHFQFKTLNHGTLVRPAVHVSALEMKRGEQKWQIVFVSQLCDAKAEKVMFTLQQLQKALGKNSDRVSLTLLANSSCQQVASAFRKLELTPQNDQQLQDALGARIAMGDKIYLVDPIGNLFMYYPSATDQMNILKDMKKVLEVSQIG